MRKSIILPSACALSAVLASGCAASGDSEQPEPAFVGMPNPFIEVSDLKGAAELAGFPASFEGACSGKSVIRVIKGSLAEIICLKGDDELYRVRKGAGTDDVSGDYNDYQRKEERKDSGGRTLTLKGNDGKSWSLASWQDGNFSYSVSPARPIGTAELLSLAEKLR